MEDQSKYKYIMDIEGNAIAFRLGYLLSLNSVIIRVESDYEFWLDYFVSDKQVITIPPYDKESLENTLKYCNDNPQFSKQLAENCVKLYEKIYNKNGILKYLEDVIFNIF
jgi:hypothetical protein